MKKTHLLKTGFCLMACASLSLGSACGGAKTSVLNAQPVHLVADAVWEYMQSPDDLAITELQAKLGYTRADRLDMGKPVEIAFSDDLAKDDSILSAFIRVSENSNMSNGVSYSIDPKVNKIRVYNLKTGTRYYYELVFNRTNQKVCLAGNFTTAESPRFMAVDGASNVRDIGGWNSTLGGKIKQGVLYRGSEIDGKKNTGIDGFCLTETGIETMLSVMRIRSDFDLRNPSSLGINPNSAGILGEEVQRTFLPSGYYEQILAQPETLKTVFTAFADPDAYPVYLHCTHGVDRAGTIALVLEALLGVDKSDLIRDYELSNFFYPDDKVDRYYDRNGGDILTLISMLESDYEGATLADKTADMLQKAGVTETQISTIRSIFIEK